ncbi:Hypothetical predicted protein, partial [Marmota monax]
LKLRNIPECECDMSAPNNSWPDFHQSVVLCPPRNLPYVPLFLTSPSQLLLLPSSLALNVTK